MIDTLARVLAANSLEPDAFVPGSSEETIFRGEVPTGRVAQTWANLAKAATETKYWPIIRGESDDIQIQTERDPASILAAVPEGGIRDILQPRVRERAAFIAEIIPDAATLTDLDQLAAIADRSGIYSFSGRKQSNQDWPAKPIAADNVRFHTLRKQKGTASELLLIRVERSCDVPAYLEFGGWNDCPTPELQVAALREWRSEYKAVPACITGDVLECAVINRPQTEAQSMKLAAEQWIFCEDIVGQGTQSVRKLAMEIWCSPTWFFWWD